MSDMKPFLKWAGGKSRLALQIASYLPPSSRLVEPFAGSGAVFMGVERQSYLIADVNEDLFHLYGTLRQHGQAFIDECRALFLPENNFVEPFMALREEFNRTIMGDRRRAVIFVYLNRHCFNGLCRYNSTGGFNVPFGRGTPHFPELEMRAFAEKARIADIRCQDFMTTLSEAREGDVVYCDPPYDRLSETASFDAYAKGGFSNAQQKQIADACEGLRQRGIASIISNHATDYTKRLYNGCTEILYHDVRRSIAGNGSRRNKAAELFAVYLPDGCTVPAALQKAMDDQREQQEAAAWRAYDKTKNEAAEPPVEVYVEPFQMAA
jgi:DNA adenine methylase